MSALVAVTVAFSTPITHAYPSPPSRTTSQICLRPTAFHHFLSSQSTQSRRRPTVRMNADHTHSNQADNDSQSQSDPHIISNLGTPPPVDEFDRAAVSDITDKGAETVAEIADDLRADLDQIRNDTERMADNLIAEETAALLDRYNDKKEDILNNVQQERKLILSEMNNVEDLAKSIDSNLKTSSPSNSTTTTTILLATTALFTLAAIYYAYIGLLNSDASSLTNAVIDLVFAVASAFFLSRETNKEEST